MDEQEHSGSGEETVVEVEHLPGRFRVLDDGGQQIAHLDYEVRTDDRGEIWDLTHTWASESHRGTGLASALVAAALDEARAEQVRIIPTCPYLPVWLRRHPEYADLVQR